MESNGKKKKSVPARREEFVNDYIRGSELFEGATPTQADARKAWADAKNAGKRKRVICKPQITKEEFRAQYLKGCEWLGETPTEQGFNREWNLIEIERQYRAIRGRNATDTNRKRNAFIEHKEEELKRGYPSTE